MFSASDIWESRADISELISSKDLPSELFGMNVTSITIAAVKSVAEMIRPVAKIGQRILLCCFLFEISVGNCGLMIGCE